MNNNIFKIKNKTFDLSQKPIIMGILNITPDSFSDGNLFFKKDDLSNTLKYVEKMILDGVDIIDIGGESSRPNSKRISANEELDRILETIVLIKKNFEIPVSVDTYKYEVAKEVLNLGVEMINDIYALNHSNEIANLIAEHKAGLCLMHMKGNPETMQNDTSYKDENNVINEISSYLAKSVSIALERGVEKEYISIDPGIGFGKDLISNLQILNRLEELNKKMSYPILIGTSRKSFIGELLNEKNPNNRLSGTIASNVIALNNGAKLFRVHDVIEHRDALDTAFKINQEIK